MAIEHVSCNEVETVNAFTHLGDEVRTRGRCEVGGNVSFFAVLCSQNTTSCKKRPLNLTKTAFKRHVSPAILYEGEVWK